MEVPHDTIPSLRPEGLPVHLFSFTILLVSKLGTISDVRRSVTKLRDMSGKIARPLPVRLSKPPYM
jgi:hypothetical protein